MKRIEDIQDNEIRVIGPKGELHSASGSRRRTLIIALGAVALLVLATVLILLLRTRPQDQPTTEVFDPSASTVSPIRPYKGPVTPLSEMADTSGKAFAEHIQRTVNDIPLEIYIPHNAVPRLMVGVPDIFDKAIVLTTQAADIRADNGKINGAFVLAGKPLAWGLSKKGYVAIIDGRITVGTADNSPLFEEATEKEGYFFRQYPLVHEGSLVENEPKNKAIRKAICDRSGEIFVAMTTTRESLHDFSQALADLGVDEAAYLVGADSYGYFRDCYDHFTQFSEKRGGGYQYENFIVWERSISQ